MGQENEQSDGNKAVQSGVRVVIREDLSHGLFPGQEWKSLPDNYTTDRTGVVDGENDGTYMIKIDGPSGKNCKVPVKPDELDVIKG